MKKIIFNYNEILFEFNRRVDYISDLGCGFSLFEFKDKIDTYVVNEFFNCCVSKSIFFNNINFNSYVNLFNGFNVDNDFLSGQYKQYMKIFGGNHFIEFGKTEKKSYYLLVHCGSNGFFSYLANKNIDKIDEVSKFCENYAKLNRTSIIERFAQIFDIDYDRSKILDQQHTFMTKDGYILGYSKVDELNGNLFCGGPFQPSYIVRCNNKNVYIKHGCQELKSIRFVDYLKYNKKDYLNYGRSFESIKNYDFKNVEILKKFYPKITRRPMSIN